MDGLLSYYKSKNKKETVRCAIKLKDKNVKDSDQNYSKFAIFNKDKKTLKKVLSFDVIKSVTRFNDGSWAIVTKSGNTYRFIDSEPKRNEKWYKMIIGEEEEKEEVIQEEDEETEDAGVVLNDTIDLNEENENNVSKYIDEESDVEKTNKKNVKRADSEPEIIELESSPITFDLKEGVEVRIEPDKTDKKFLNIFSLDYIYELKFDHTLLVLLDKATNKIYNFDIERIKRYGCHSNCFIFELGRNLEYGPGIIAFKSADSKPTRFYNDFNESFTAEINELKQKVEEFSASNPTISVTPLNAANLKEYSPKITKVDGKTTNGAPPLLTTSRVNIVTNEPMSGNNNDDVEIPIGLSHSFTKRDAAVAAKKPVKSFNENLSTVDYQHYGQETVVFDNHNNRFEIIAKNDYSIVKKNMKADFSKYVELEKPTAEEKTVSEKSTYLVPTPPATPAVNNTPNPVNPINYTASTIIATPTTNTTSPTVHATSTTTNPVTPSTSSTKKKELKLLPENSKALDEDDSDEFVETDESFYLDKYKPEYMNKNETKEANVFVDKDKSVYGKVKL